jgi:hypothetical protein
VAKALQVRSRNPAGCDKIAQESKPLRSAARQMLFTLRSIVLFSSSIAASPCVCGPVTSVPRSAKLDQAPVRNVRTWLAMTREKAQVAPTAKPKVPMRR